MFITSKLAVEKTVQSLGLVQSSCERPSAFVLLADLQKYFLTYQFKFNLFLLYPFYRSWEFFNEILVVINKLKTNKINYHKHQQIKSHNNHCK